MAIDTCIQVWFGQVGRFNYGGFLVRAGSYVYPGSIARVFASSWGSLVPVRSSVCGSRAVVASASIYIYRFLVRNKNYLSDRLGSYTYG